MAQERNPYRNKDLRACWEEGYVAQTEGRIILECPYDFYSEPAVAGAWTLGWATAVNDDLDAMRSA